MEPVRVPEGVPLGERVVAHEYPGEPEARLNPKKKVWEKLQPMFSTTAGKSGLAVGSGTTLAEMFFDLETVLRKSAKAQCCNYRVQCCTMPPMCSMPHVLIAWLGMQDDVGGSSIVAFQVSAIIVQRQHN